MKAQAANGVRQVLYSVGGSTHTTMNCDAVSFTPAVSSQLFGVDGRLGVDLPISCLSDVFSNPDRTGHLLRDRS